MRWLTRSRRCERCGRPATRYGLFVEGGIIRDDVFMLVAPCVAKTSAGCALYDYNEDLVAEAQAAEDGYR